MGPSAIRYAGLEERLTALGVDCVDRGNVATAVAEATAEHDPRARFLPAIRATCERIAGLVGAALDDGRVPIVLGGDHSIALGTLGGLASRRGPGAVLWFDAHGDLNTPETTPSGNVHGMPLAAALGRGGPEFESASWTLPALQPERVAVIGARDLDPGERALIGELGLAVHTMSELDRRGIEAVVTESLERAANAPFVHISLDMDGLDPDVAPGVGTAVRGGLTYREAHLAMELGSRIRAVVLPRDCRGQPDPRPRQRDRRPRGRARRQRPRGDHAVAASTVISMAAVGMPGDRAAAAATRSYREATTRNTAPAAPALAAPCRALRERLSVRRSVSTHYWKSSISTASRRSNPCAKTAPLPRSSSPTVRSCSCRIGPGALLRPSPIKNRTCSFQRIRLKQALMARRRSCSSGPWPGGIGVCRRRAASSGRAWRPRAIVLTACGSPATSPTRAGSVAGPRRRTASLRRSRSDRPGSR